MKLEKTVLGYSIWAEITKLDDGWEVGIYGGCSTHVGAVTLAEPDGTVQTLERSGHKDSLISARWAAELAAHWNSPVCVRCGIHYDNAPKEQLAEIIAACDDMLQEVISRGKQERKNEMYPISILNQTMELAEYQDKWFLDKKHGCWCLEDILYVPNSKVPAFQRMSIYAPKNLMNADGTPAGQSKTVPIIFENNAAGYMQMPHTWLDNARCHARQYLERGFVYVTCGCSGRESRDCEGNPVGKAPATLIDLKTAIRFLRHNAAAVPGDMNKIVSVGVSAGGAMSSLLGVTGDNANYLPYLEANGAFLDESDSVFAAQCYCPIIDLEHSDLAYEWMFRQDKTCEDSHAGPAETMDAFKDALSAVLAKKYIAYFNGLALHDPVTGEALKLNEDGRSGSAYNYLLSCFNTAATKHLKLLDQGKLGVSYGAAAYVSGNYTETVPAPMPKRKKESHHVGPNAVLEETEKPLTPGEMMLRPPADAPQPEVPRIPMVERKGTDKRSWLRWDGEQAQIRDLDAYILNHRRRMKPCTSFDTLAMNSGENHVFGNAEADYVHFSEAIADAISELKDPFPEEYVRYYGAYEKYAGNKEIGKMLYLFNPMNFVGTKEKSTQAKHFRIRVGGQDADTATTISMTLALKLANQGCESVDYAIVWDQPHCDADYPGEVCDWIDRIREQ